MKPTTATLQWTPRTQAVAEDVAIIVGTAQIVIRAALLRQTPTVPGQSAATALQMTFLMRNHDTALKLRQAALSPTLILPSTCLSGLTGMVVVFLNQKIMIR